MTIVFLKFWPKKYKQGIFGHRFSHFHFFSQNFANTQIRGSWFQMTILFSNWAYMGFFWQNFQIREIRGTQKCPNKEFFVLNVSISYICMKLHILKNLKTLISKMAIFFFQSHPKNTQIRNFIWKLTFLFTCNSEWTQLYLVELNDKSLNIVIVVFYVFRNL